MKPKYTKLAAIAGSLSLLLIALSSGAASAADAATMRQYQLEQKPDGAGYHPVLKTASIPEPAANEVLIRMRAVSLNRKDIIFQDRANQSGQGTPGLTISDGAGDVVAVGSAVTRFHAGDRVVPAFDSVWGDGPRTTIRPREGLLSEYVVVTEDTLLPIPEYMSYAEAATLPCAAVTAWTSLFKESQLKPGEYVLLEGTGGVSIFGLQLAAAAGARPIITSSSDAKLARARELGAIGTVNYRSHPEWQDDVKKITGADGVMHVLEVGGKDTLPRALKTLAPGGHIAQIGGLSEGGYIRGTPEDVLKGYDVRYSQIYVGSRADFEDMNRFMTEHEIHPVIDRVFPFEEAMAAYQAMVDEDFLGKIVITVNAD